MGTDGLVVVGDALLDRDVVGSAERLCPEAPVPVLEAAETVDRPGGAALAAALAARQGHRVVLVTAVAADPAGDRIRDLMAACGVTTVAAPLRSPTVEKIRLRVGHHVLLRVDRGGPRERDGGDDAIGAMPAAAFDAIAAARAVLVSDYGYGMSAVCPVRAALRDRTPRLPMVWDPHPRGRQPVEAARLVTPNSSELRAFANGAFADGGGGEGLELLAEATEAVRKRWGCDGVSVTMGSRGALLVAADQPSVTVSPPLQASGDSCGAGDRFAVAALAELAAGSELTAAVRAGVDAASQFVADGAAAGLRLPAHGPEPFHG